MADDLDELLDEVENKIFASSKRQCQPKSEKVQNQSSKTTSSSRLCTENDKHRAINKAEHTLEKHVVGRYLIFIYVCWSVE